MFKFLKEIKDVVNQATQLWQESRDGQGKEGWIVFFEARSFWLSVISVIFAAMSIAGFVPPFGEQIVVEVVTQVIAAVSALWAVIERIRGKKSIVWSTNQANAAIKQAQAAKGK